MIALRSDYGGVLNYTLFSAGSGQWAPGSLLFSGSSATLDARAFSPFGTLSQSAILRTAFNNRFDALRLDTAFSYSDRETLTTYRAGDAINGGLAWTRPIRIGGLQAQRSFGLRPDLVTLPLPSASGSAAVPSTVDVFVNNVRTSSQEVESGPYRISNLSATTGSGNARVVLRDASGRETVTDLPFYVSSKMLAPGLFDFSMEAGAPRLSYGTTADTYGKTFVASASGRRGVLDWLTLEGHAEAGAGLWNAGAGAVIRTGSFGVASGALAASDYGGKLGLQSYVAYETGIWGLTVQLSSQRTFGPYDDLASVTARLQHRYVGRSAEFGGRTLVHQPGMDSRHRPHVVVAQRAPSQGTRPILDRFTIAVRPLDTQRKLHPPRRCLGQGLKRSVRILVAGVCVQCHRLRYRLHGRQRPQELRISGRPFDPDRGRGIGIVRRLKGQERHQFDLRRRQALAQQPGSFGWRAHDSEGATPDRSASIGYRSDYARVEAGVRQYGRNSSATAEIEGAVVTMGNGVFLANRIDDSFAVIETGMPGVEVFQENRSVGFTDSDGRALVTGLRSYQKNKIAIDTRNLPVDADVSTTQDIVVPADRSGVRVNFGVRTNTSAAILVLTGPDGQPMPAGSEGKVEGGERFVVGYDGRAWVKGLAAQNTVSVELPAGECHGAFAYSSRANEQVTIPVGCH